MHSDWKRTLLGYGVALQADIFWVTSGAAVQALGGRVPDFELGVLRYIGGMLCAALIMCFYKRTELVLPQESYVNVILLGFCSMGFNCLYFFAVAYVPLSHTSLCIIGIMIMITVLSKVLFDKTPNMIISISIVGCILGMLALVQPWKDFTDGFTSALTNLSVPVTTNSTSTLPVVLGPTWQLVAGYCALVGAAAIEGYYSILVGVYLKNVKPGFLTFLSSAVALPISLVGSFYLEQPVWITEPYTILLVSIHVVGTGGALLCQVAACQMIQPIHATMIMNLIPVLNLILQYTMFGSTLYGRRNVMEVAGCLLIVASVLLSGLFNNDEKHEDF